MCLALQRSDVHFDGLPDDDNSWLPAERMRYLTPPPTTADGSNGTMHASRSKRNVTPIDTMAEPDPLLSPRAKLAGTGHCVALF